MIDIEQLSSVLNSLQSIDIERYSRLQSIKGLWEAGIVHASKMQQALDEQIAFVSEYYFPSESQGVPLSDTAITLADLEGYEVTTEGDRYRVKGRQTVVIPKNLDKNIFNEIKTTL